VVQAVRQAVHLSSAFFGCGFLMLLLGMIDDRFELKPAFKFLGQICIVVLLWALGVKIQTLPFSAGTQPLSDSVSLLLTLI
jgi:UDP-N-acetylmuramyl pentapeptide phosphotransferase/UDP-N-acetylglucosamine-1-phosphate transferase